MPLVRCLRRAGDRSRHPAVVVSVVDAPDPRGESALCPEDIFFRIYSLVHFEFQRLWCVRVLYVVIKVIDKISGGRTVRYRLPPVCVRIIVGTAEEKLHRRSVERRRSNALLEPVGRKCARAGGAGALATRFPACCLFQIRLEGLSGGTDCERYQQT